MSVFYVFQGETYEVERKYEFVWSPQLDKSGHRNAGYTMMTNVRKGDFILHNENGKVVSISIAKGDYYEASQPRELEEADTTVKWNDEGYRVDLKYFDLDKPLMVTNYTEWLKKHFIEGSAFTKAGKGKQQYMCRLADAHAIFLLEKAKELQTDQDVTECLENALAASMEDKELNDDQIEMESVNEIVDDTTADEKPEWPGVREEQAMEQSTKTGREIPKRDAKRSADALKHADYLCEYNSEDRTFVRKNGKPYTEPHHLIPISKYRDFKYSVDVMENIVSLCSHCHNLLHYGQLEDKKPLLKKLYRERIEALRVCGLDLTLKQLISYYR